MKKYLHSLRFRYALSAIILILLVVVASGVAYRSFKSAERDTVGHLQIQNQLRLTLRKIRISLLECHVNIDAYLLAPGHAEYKQKALNELANALQRTAEMKGQYSALLPPASGTVEELGELLGRLKQRTEKLFQVREDHFSQFPSLAVANRIMRPNRNAFVNAIAVTLDEIKQESRVKRERAVYDQVIQVRYAWGRMISDFRLYLANRMGTFNEAALPIQERAVSTLYADLRHELQKLASFDAKGQVGFQGSAALNEMFESSEQWFAGFEQVREIHGSDSWRIDSNIMRDSIVPLIDEISITLSNIEAALGKVSGEDVVLLTSVANQTSNIMLWTASALVVFMIILFISTNRLVFAPVAAVVRALKAETSGKERVLLPQVQPQEIEALIEAFSDMRRHIQQRQSALDYQALHDGLTALPNRTLLQERIAHYIQTARREQRPVALLVIDLDRFKEINDALGHHIGDQVLVEVSLRLLAELGELDTVARLGGDEFAVLLPECDAEDAILMCKKLLRAMDEVLEIEGMALPVSMSIGACFFPQHGDDVATLLRRADVAMYTAKKNKLGYAIYNVDEDEYSVGRLALINDLRNAIDNDQLMIYFQPIISLKNNTVKGVEALLRWRHPTLGFITPDQIVNLAEQVAMIDTLSYWVIAQTFKQVRTLLQRYVALDVSINISSYNLKDEGFVSKVETLLDQHKVPAQRIIFEITESAMMTNPARVAEMLRRMDAMGLRFAVDDYGTGFSSLAYLKHLPVSELKIDKTFITGMLNDGSDEVIVHSTIEMAQRLGLLVVGEGVENRQILEKLQSFACDTLQGYYLCAPLPQRELEHWIEQNYSVAANFS